MKYKTRKTKLCQNQINIEKKEMHKKLINLFLARK